MEDLGKSAYPPPHIFPCDDSTCSVCGDPTLQKLLTSSQYGKSIEIGGSSNGQYEQYDLLIICRYITEMHGLLKRFEPVIDDIADFAEFMREFKDYAKDDLETLSGVLKRAEDAKED